MKPERAYFRPEKVDLRPNRTDFRPRIALEGGGNTENTEKWGRCPIRSL